MRPLTITLPLTVAIALRRFKAQALTEMTDEEAVVALLRDSLLHLGDFEMQREIDEETATEGNA